MDIFSSKIEEIKIIQPKIHTDHRGSFIESFNSNRYQSLLGLTQPFFQDNLSVSSYRTLRGLHFQYPKSQGKLVSILKGNALDIAVDIRLGSPTFGQHVAIHLAEDNYRQIWIPRGFAHGFVALSQQVIICYKCDEYYSPENEHSILWNDRNLKIKWPIQNPVISEVDANAPALSEIPSKRLPKYKSTAV